MPLTVQSRARRMQVFHLPHDVFCRDRCACEDVTSVIVAENPRTGERARRQLTKKVPGSITFLALEQKRGMPAALLQVAEVKAAIGRGYLRVVEHTPDPAIAPASASVPGDPSPSGGAGVPPASGSIPSPAANAASPARSRRPLALVASQAPVCRPPADRYPHPLRTQHRRRLRRHQRQRPPRARQRRSRRPPGRSRR